jgi:hypothetical protein
MMEVPKKVLLHGKPITNVDSYKEPWHIEYNNLLLKYIRKGPMILINPTPIPISPSKMRYND